MESGAKTGTGAGRGSHLAVSVRPNVCFVRILEKPAFLLHVLKGVRTLTAIEYCENDSSHIHAVCEQVLPLASLYQAGPPMWVRTEGGTSGGIQTLVHSSLLLFPMLAPLRTCLNFLSVATDLVFGLYGH